MAAKLLHSLADDNPDLQKQIGCMTGIFQMFDRHHIVTGRRTSNNRIPSGSSHSNSGKLGREYTIIHHRETASELTLNESVNEKRRIHLDSSRASFSSSCSSLSSLDCNKPAQPEASSFHQMIIPQTHLQDVVKDSMYREARPFSIETAGEETPSRAVKHKDSLRPSRVGKNGKQEVPDDLKESLRVLAKLRDAPRYYDEARERSRSSSYEAKDAPQFSYDGRERNRVSFESRDSNRSILKLKELPRLSLDGRERSLRGGSISILTQFSRNINNSDCSSEKSSDSQLPSRMPTRAPSVVAKLMGLEALPDSSLATGDPTTKSLNTTSLVRPIRASDSPKNSVKPPTSPRRRNADLIMKPIQNSRLPIEVAPWRQLDGNHRISKKPGFGSVKGQARGPNSFPSVYGEIEKKLKDLEFNQSGKDLRALKQILEAMQTKGLTETRNEEEASNFGTPRDGRLKSNRQSNHNQVTSTMASSSSRAYESPIVLMRPAKLVEKSSISSSPVIPLDGLPTLHKLQKKGFPDSKRSSSSGSTTPKDLSPKNNHISSRNNVRPPQSSSRAQQFPKENSTSSIKSSSGSVSPRLQEKKLEFEKRSRPPTPPSDPSKPRRKSNRQATTDLSASSGKPRPKSSNLPQCDDQLSEISNESRTLSYQSDSNLSFDSKMDIEVTSQSPPMESAKHLGLGSVIKNSTLRCEEDESLAELANIAPDHPSPVSVLDASIYRDDELSPVKQISNALSGAHALEANGCLVEDQWNLADNLLTKSIDSTRTVNINREKLQNIDNLVQKLRRLNSHHDEAKTDYIASLSENRHPDNRYISEILLASGLLLRDLGCGLKSFQLHPSGHPINPELFYVLEQTKTSNLLPKEDQCYYPLRSPLSKPSKEKSHRKLIFDFVNEILAGKLASVGDSSEPWLMPNKLAKKTLSAQRLLKELCFEIEQFQAEKYQCSLDEEEDSLKSILCEDVMCRSESWTDFNGDISGVVLDVERLIFKDLVDEVGHGEASHLQAKSGRRRQLFAM